MAMEKKGRHGYVRAFDRIRHEDELEHGYCFTLEQVKDVLWLVANGEYPNAEFGDNECALWSVIRRELNIND